MPAEFARSHSRVFSKRTMACLFLCLLIVLLFALPAQSVRSTATATLQPAVSDPPGAGRSPITTTDAYTTCVYLPSVYLAPPVNLGSRESSLEFYMEEYLAPGEVSCTWTGNPDTCEAGSVNSECLDAILRRINYFRAMAGVPHHMVWDSGYNRKAQAAALMMSVNRDLDHYPPPTWQCYSSDGAEGASHSNLGLGSAGPASIRSYMYDAGSGNYAVGHRRWILYPNTTAMGTGNVIPIQTYPSANALWVVGSTVWPRPPTRDDFVAWPPPGYVPSPVVFPRWSFSYPGADFFSATVTMSSGGNPIALTLEDVRNGYGENTVVWVPQDVTFPEADTTFTVHVQNVLIAGEPCDFVYDVIIFDPMIP